MAMKGALLALFVGLAACSTAGPEITLVHDGGSKKRGNLGPDEESQDAGARSQGMDGFSIVFPDAAHYETTMVQKVLVYAHTGSDLVSIDPETLKVSRVGNFHIPMAGGRMKFLNDVTDIAVDRDGKIVGTTPNLLLAIDATDAACTEIASLPPGNLFNGLSWIRLDGGQEQLMTTSREGNLYRLDPATGEATMIGPLGPGLHSSGDLVSVESYGTLVTLTGPSSDRLAQIDPKTGAATIIGDTGFKRVFGLGFWGSQVFGFTEAGDFILIDPRTGAGKLVMNDGAFPFWGAGVTTSVPVIR